MRKWIKHSDYFSQNDKIITHASTMAIFTEKLRNGLSLRITAFENYVSASGAWTNITWQLCCNGTPISPFDNQKTQLGQQGIPQEVLVDFIFPPASMLSVNAINGDAVNDWLAGVILKGEYGYYE